MYVYIYIHACVYIYIYIYNSAAPMRKVAALHASIYSASCFIGNHAWEMVCIEPVMTIHD